MKQFADSLEFLIHPKNAFRNSMGMPVRTAFGYMFMLLVIYALLGGALTLLLTGNTFAAAMAALASYLTGALATVVTAVWLYPFASVAGVRSFRYTVKTVLYGSTPSYLLGGFLVLPFAGKYIRIALTVWGFVLFWVSLKHMTPSRKAGAAVAAAFALGFIIFILLAFTLITVVFPMMLALAQ